MTTTKKKPKKKLPYGPVNVEMFQKIKAKILADPKHFDMDDWGKSKPRCGTVCCIGGWAMAFNYLEEHETLKDATEYDLIYSDIDPLGLCGGDDHTGDVFYIDEWPEPFKDMYETAKSNTARAQAAAKYIDWICGKGKDYEKED